MYLYLAALFYLDVVKHSNQAVKYILTEVYKSCSLHVVVYIFF